MMEKLFRILVLLLAPIISCSAQELFQESGDVSPAQVDKIYLKGLSYLVKGQNSEGR